jgi:mono/diheme cytochrome c family protein
MANQPRFEAYEGSQNLPDGSSARLLPTGVVARGFTRDDALLYQGRGADGEFADEFPFPITAEVMATGQAQFNAQCTPCHDAIGTGLGMVVLAGYPQPPSLHIDRLRQAPAGYIFDVITNGHNAMPSLAEQVPAEERWAVVAYLRALQLSQNATIEEVPPDARGQLSGEGSSP